MGVVAQTEWAAIQAARALKVTLGRAETKMPSGADEVFDYLKNTKSFGITSPRIKETWKLRSRRRIKNTKRPISGRSSFMA